MAEVVRPLDPRDIVAPLLPSLPVAAFASQPASGVLPLLSPILRQRVQFLSASSSEPWIRLLSYDAAKAAKLIEIARSTRLEPHPLSGEIEIDWDSSTGDHVETRYKRLDVETLQALVLLRDLDLVFRLVHCAGDEQEGNTSSSGGWRVGEVSVPDEPNAFGVFGGHATVAEAERAFSEETAVKATISTTTNHYHNNNNTTTTSIPTPTSIDNNDNIDDDDDDDDDDYWARYDATPARTPAIKRSPAPSSLRQSSAQNDGSHNTAQNAEAEDAYFAQYDTVQPAMDSHDPDEVVEGEEVQSGLTGGVTTGLINSYNLSQQAQQGAAAAPEHAIVDNEYEVDHERLANLVHPRPASASSHGSSSLGGAGGSGGSAVIVSKLEAHAGRQEQSEFGVKQHVSRSIKSLYMLARASGIDRDEFEQLVKTELDMLSMLEE
jgi:hypothetical protein